MIQKIEAWVTSKDPGVEDYRQAHRTPEAAAKADLLRNIDKVVNVQFSEYVAKLTDDQLKGVKLCIDGYFEDMNQIKHGEKEI